MSCRAVIFDMDGVLVDTEPMYRENNNRVFSRLGIRVSDEEYAAFVGTSAERMWTTLKKEFGLPHPVAELVRMESDEQHGGLLKLARLEPIPGVNDLIDRLRAASARLAVASSSSRAVVDLTLEKAGFAGRFEAVVCGDEVSHGKPHPEIFLKTAEKLGVAASACMVIEDSPRGIEGAAAAGMKTVGFRNPNSGKQDVSRAHLVVERFSAEGNAGIIRLLSA